jgi:hypothetical protein
MANELVLRESALISAIEKELPDFARMCRDLGSQTVVMHQDAFAADYQEQEYKLLGMAVKFAGICGKEVRVIGRNRQTVDQTTTTR